MRPAAVIHQDAMNEIVLLKARITALEAALRKIESNAGELDLTGCAQIARAALETK